MKARDIYDDSVEYLTAHPDMIYDAHCFDEEFFGGALFRSLTPDGRVSFLYVDPDKKTRIGNIISVHSIDGFVAPTPALTALLKADNRIPKNGKEIKVEHLEIFACYQRFFDKEIPRTKEWEYRGDAPLTDILLWLQDSHTDRTSK